MGSDGNSNVTNLSGSFYLNLFTLFSLADAVSQDYSRVVTSLSTDGNLRPRPEIVHDGVPGNPGSKFAITEKFSHYANEVLVDLLNDLAPKLPLPDIQFQTGSDGNVVKFTNLKVRRFTTAKNGSKIEFRPVNELTWNISDVNVDIGGDFETNYNGMTAAGQFNGTAESMQISQKLRVNIGPYGRLQLSAGECRAKIGKLDLQVYNAGIFDQIFRALKLFLIGFAKTNVEQKICDELTSLLNNYVDGKLHDLPTKLPLVTFFPFAKQQQQNASSSATKIDKKNDILQNLYIIIEWLYLDYSLLGDPVISNNSLNLHSRSEISFEGNGDTPFFPATMDDSCDQSMLCLSVSDYVINSFLWHAYKHGSLNFHVNKLSNRNYLVDESCDQQRGDGEEFCVKRILRDAQSLYPNSEFNLLIQPIESPAVIIEEDQAKILTKNYANLLARSARSTTSILETELIAMARFTPLYLAENSYFYANFTIERLNMKLIKSANSIAPLLKNDTVLERLGEMIKHLVEEQLNNFLHGGIRTPNLREIRFVNSNFKLANRRLKIQTDIEVVKNDLQQIVSNALFDLLDSNGE